MKRKRPGILWSLLCLSIATFGAIAAISCGGDDNDSSRAVPTSTPAPAGLGEAQVGSISITNASMRETANDVTAMYMTIKTTGTGDRLVGMTTPISPMAQLHETVMTNGAMQMQEVAGGIAIPPAGEVVLKPGGLHAMLMQLSAPLKAGQTVNVELKFEKAGKVSLTVPVKTIGGMSGGPTSGGTMGSGSPPWRPLDPAELPLLRHARYRWNYWILVAHA